MVSCNIIHIPKTGNSKFPEVDNYRGIALYTVGFRSGISTITHSIALRRSIEGIQFHNLKVIITFGDFRKAFDSLTEVVSS